MSKKTPSRIWIDRHDIPSVSMDLQFDPDYIEFVRADLLDTAVKETWDKAIETLERAAEDSPCFVYHSERGRKFTIDAMKAARDKKKPSAPTSNNQP